MHILINYENGHWKSLILLNDIIDERRNRLTKGSSIVERKKEI